MPSCSSAPADHCQQGELHQAWATDLDLPDAVVPSASQQLTAQSLVKRLLPDHHHLFKLQLQQDASSGWFSLEVKAGRVHVCGTSGVELASGVHWFLKHWADSSVSWHATGGLQLGDYSLEAERLAEMEARGKETIERAVPFSFYQNVVTMSYSMAFWEWDR